VSGVAVILHDRATAPWQLVAALMLLIVLLATLGTLQYRWLGEVSEAERGRMRDGLRARASEFTQAFDRELTRTYSTFHLTSDQIAGGERAALEEAWNRWRAGAPAPGLVHDVYLAQGVTFESAQVQRLDPARHTLEPVAWPPELADSLARTHQALPRVLGTPNATAPVFLTDAIDSRIPALIVHARNWIRSWTYTADSLPCLGSRNENAVGGDAGSVLEKANASSRLVQLPSTPALRACTPIWPETAALPYSSRKPRS